MEMTKSPAFAKRTAPSLLMKTSQPMPVDMPIFLRAQGSATSSITRMCAGRHASRTQSTRSHLRTRHPSSDRRADSASGGSYSSHNHGSAAWAKPCCLSRQWQQRTTKAASLDDARFAGKTASEAPRVISVRFAYGAMWTISARTKPSQTPRTSRTLHLRLKLRD